MTEGTYSRTWNDREASAPSCLIIIQVFAMLKFFFSWT